MPGRASPLLASCADLIRGSMARTPERSCARDIVALYARHARPPDQVRGCSAHPYQPSPPGVGQARGWPDKPGHESAGACGAERAPHHESGIRRSLDLMRDSPGLGGILRDKVGLSEISGIPRQRFLPESRPSARPTFPSSRVQRAWTLRRAPQLPSHAMPPSRHTRTCPASFWVSAHPYGKPTGHDPFARPPHGGILSRPRRAVHRTMVLG